MGEGAVPEEGVVQVSRHARGCVHPFAVALSNQQWDFNSFPLVLDLDVDFWIVIGCFLTCKTMAFLMILRVVLVEMILHKFMLPLKNRDYSRSLAHAGLLHVKENRVQPQADMIWSEFWIHEKISSNIKFKIMRGFFFKYQIQN